MIVESAHLQRRDRLSLAQPFNLEGLTNLADYSSKYDWTIKLFPAKMTPRARDEAGIDGKNDPTHGEISDAEAIKIYCENHLVLTLKTWLAPY